MFFGIVLVIMLGVSDGQSVKTARFVAHNHLQMAENRSHFGDKRANSAVECALRIQKLGGYAAQYCKSAHICSIYGASKINEVMTDVVVDTGCKFIVLQDALTDKTTIFRWPYPQSRERYVKLITTTPEMTAITACLWAKTTFAASNYIHLLSYAVSGNTNAFLAGFVGNGNIFFYVCGQHFNTPIPSSEITDGAWHHWCFAWNNGVGAWTVFRDGMPAAGGTGFQTSRSIPPNGVWIVGQDQDSEGGGFEVNQAYVGDVTSVNVWNTNNVNVTAMANCRENFGGNVISWDNVTRESHEMSTYEEVLCRYR